MRELVECQPMRTKLSKVYVQSPGPVRKPVEPCCDRYRGVLLKDEKRTESESVAETLYR